jgi:hypothetical protein
VTEEVVGLQLKAGRELVDDEFVVVAHDDVLCHLHLIQILF